MIKATPLLIAIVVAGSASFGRAAVIGSDYRDAVLSLNPVGYWEFEGSGDLLDSSGNGHHATNTINSVTGQPGAYPALGNSYTLPGGQDVSYNVNNPGDTGDFSVALWFKGGTRKNALITKGVYSRNADPHFSWDLFTKPNHTVRFKAGDGITPPNNNFLWDFEVAIPDTDDWIFVVATWDGTTDADAVNVYVNGVLAGSATSTSTAITTAHDVGIGGRNAWTWDGGLDEVAIFDHALTAQDAANLYQLAGAIPEPASLMLMGVGAMLIVRRRN